MKKYYLILLLFIPVLSIAQSNFKKGYVINLKGDTSRGYIDYKEWPKNPATIDFKSGLNPDKVEHLSANDIDLFEIDGFEIYQRFVLKISLDATDLNHASSGIDTTSKTGTVFLRVLQKGKNVVLYSYADAIKTRFYIKDNNAAIPQELTYRAYMDADNQNWVTKNIFRGQLGFLANAYQVNGIDQQIERAEYNEYDLIRIITKINGSNEKQNANLPNGRHGIHFFLGTGLNVSTLKYTGDSPFPNAPAAASAMPKLALGFNSFINPNIGRLVLRVELDFTANNFAVKNLTTNSSVSGPSVIGIQNIKQLTASIIPQIIYNLYNTDPFKFFVGTGLSLGLSSYPTNQYNASDGTSSTIFNNYPELRNLSISLVTKAGIVLNKRLEIYGAYIPSIEPITNNYVYFSGNITTYEMGVNFLFGKK
jgi:hypothetical protein